MPAIAMGIAYAGYTLGLWGYCLVRGYNVTLLELTDFRHVPTWASIKGSQVPSGHVFPVPGGLAAQAAARPAAKPGTVTPADLQKLGFRLSFGDVVKAAKAKKAAR